MKKFKIKKINAKQIIGKIKRSAISAKDKVEDVVDEVKTKKKKNKGKRHPILIILLLGLIVFTLAGIGFCAYIVLNAPDFEVEKLHNSNSSVILDNKGNVIANLGNVEGQKRKNVTYDELPDVLIDAIIATEDSKFFQHSGIDLLRFVNATFGQLRGQAGAGGGSTLTMQIVKNTYNGNESRGLAGIIRKFTDIYMAVFKLEKTYTKQQIIEFYVNQSALGVSEYGVEQASEKYFGKSVSELNLSEAATIAGLFQAPGAFYPLWYPEKAEQRRNQVLNLMVRHGYITDEERNIAKSIPLTDLLKQSENTKVFENQDFIDTVISEVITRTGNNPYMTSMTIYSTMDQDKQKVINNLFAGTTYKWVNNHVQSGVVVTDVDTGAVVAVGARRNRTGARQFNYATQIERQPGSTAKPIFDYGPAIEYAGWGTGNMIIDDKYHYSNGQTINNVDNGYRGIMTAKTALAASRNIPALQVFQQTTQAQKYEFITNLGIKPVLHNGEILESSSVGAGFGVSPLLMSAAYGAFSRGGYYIEPYSFTKIVYNDTNETYTPNISKNRAMSEETAYLVNRILKYAVDSTNVKGAAVSGTDVASKTGTSSVDGALIKREKIPRNVIQDSWQIAYSPDYSIALWYGHDQTTHDHYMTSNEGWSARTAIMKVLTSNIIPKNSRWTQPKGVVAVDVELGTNPTMLASDYTPDNLRSTEYYKRGTEPTEESWRFKRLDNPTNLNYSTEGNQVTITWTPIDLPEAIDTEFLQSYFDEGYGEWSSKYYQQRLDYNEENIGIIQYEVFLKNSDGTLTSLGMTTQSKFTTSIINSSKATYVIKTRYSKFKANMSSGSEITVKINDVVIDDNTDNTNNTNNTDENNENNNTQTTP